MDLQTLLQQQFDNPGQVGLITGKNDFFEPSGHTNLP
jgi:hypothetical protein